VHRSSTPLLLPSTNIHRHVHVPLQYLHCTARSKRRPIERITDERTRVTRSHRRQRSRCLPVGTDREAPPVVVGRNLRGRFVPIPGPLPIPSANEAAGAQRIGSDQQHPAAAGRACMRRTCAFDCGGAILTKRARDSERGDQPLVWSSVSG
jgi:hypothetical protein